jgi:alpha-amylase/alpha-mannosidase (GH57 family)
MKIDIINIIKQSEIEKSILGDNQILPIHIKKAIKVIYPNSDISSKLINKSRYFLKLYKQNNSIPSGYDLDSEYDQSDIFCIIRSFNFDKGHEDSVYYMYGLIMEKTN